MKIKSFLFYLLVQNILFISSGRAATTTTTFLVTATIANACNVIATPMTFAIYNPLSTSPSNATSAINVTCIAGTAYTVALNAGTTVGGTISQRLLSDGNGHTLNYNIYTTNAYTTIWGDGTSSSQLVPATGTITATGLPQTYTAYGQIPIGQSGANRPAGTYTDTITATVTFT